VISGTVVEFVGVTETSGGTGEGIGEDVIDVDDVVFGEVINEIDEDDVVGMDEKKLRMAYSNFQRSFFHSGFFSFSFHTNGE